MTLLITSYIEKISRDPTIDWRIEKFRHLLATGVPICLFTNNVDFQALQQEFPHLQVRFFDAIKIPYWLPKEYTLPVHRKESKDTGHYIALQHLKTYFVAEAIQEHSKKHDHYAWVDPHLFSLFSDKPRMAAWIRCLCNVSCADPTTLVIPGYNKFKTTQGTPTGCIEGTPTGGVDWRFLGGFFWGHRDALLHFHDLVVKHCTHYVDVVCSGTLYWELNFWAWLEANAGLSVQWYAAGNDETRLTHFPLRAVSKRLVTKVVPMQLPVRPGFQPSSLSHCYDAATGIHRWLVRYINYTLDAERGCFIMHDTGGSIRSENLLVTSLDVACATDFSWIAFPPSPSTTPLLSYGLEDARIFPYRGGLWAVGCNVDKTVEQRWPQMAVVKIEADAFQDMVVMPATHCEKNWIPTLFGGGSNDNDGDNHGDNHGDIDFIYSWGARAIKWGRMNVDTGAWSLDDARSLDDLLAYPLLQGAKGSSLFVPFRTPGSWVGVVHSTQYEEGRALRNYWHHLVVMNDVKQVTASYGPFYFDSVGVEYCIGFWYDGCDDTFHFWVSRVDADPVYVTVHADFLST